MPEPDPRRARLAEMRDRLALLGQEITETPPGSPERAELSDRFGLLLATALVLRKELEGP